MGKRCIRVATTPPTFAPDSTGLALKQLSSEATDFVQALIERRPQERPNASDAAQSAWLRTPVTGPCLRRRLYAARRAGAFEQQRITGTDAVERRLRQLQLRHHAMLPSPQKTELPSPQKTDSHSIGSSLTCSGSKASFGNQAWSSFSSSTGQDRCA